MNKLSTPFGPLGMMARSYELDTDYKFQEKWKNIPFQMVSEENNSMEVLEE